MDAARRVIVVGGGLAGIACAVGLAGRGVKVVLLEARHALGGRASSFEDQERAGELLDNCQHVLLGCCTNLLDLYGRMGVREKIHFEKRVHFLNETKAGDGIAGVCGHSGDTITGFRGENSGDAIAGFTRHDLWAVRGLPAPLHLGAAMGSFGLLTVTERVAVVRAMLAMARMGRSGREKLEGVAFGEWLKEQRQPDSLIRKFYDPIVISALNEETRLGSAKYAIQVFQEAMLANARGYVMGLPGCALGELYAAVPGVEVRTGVRVEEVVWGKDERRKTKDERVEGAVRAVGVKLRGGEELRGDAVVLATNYHAVMRWVEGAGGLPVEVRERDGRFGGLAKLESVPILGVHLWFDRGVMKGRGGVKAVALVKGPLQWLFRKDEEGKVLHGVISAARGWERVAKEEALRQFEEQVRGLFPQAREAKLLRGVIVIEKRASFSPLPGTDALRPAQAPGAQGVRGLYLAGDYTKTGWPATMEGAVRSGYLAAEGVLKEFGMESGLLVSDLPVEWPARLAGLNR